MRVEMTNDEVDAAILAVLADGHWRKVAYVLGEVGMEQAVPVTMTEARLRALVEGRRVEAHGNLDRPGFSEVRLPERPA
jgi:hypothetical protein